MSPKKRGLYGEISEIWKTNRFENKNTSLSKIYTMNPESNPAMSAKAIDSMIDMVARESKVYFIDKCVDSLNQNIF
jgi:hypothetical protein